MRDGNKPPKENWRRQNTLNMVTWDHTRIDKTDEHIAPTRMVIIQIRVVASDEEQTTQTQERSIPNSDIAANELPVTTPTRSIQIPQEKAQTSTNAALHPDGRPYKVVNRRRRERS